MKGLAITFLVALAALTAWGFGDKAQVLGPLYAKVFRAPQDWRQPVNIVIYSAVQALFVTAVLFGGTSLIIGKTGK